MRLTWREYKFTAPEISEKQFYELKMLILSNPKSNSLLKPNIAKNWFLEFRREIYILLVINFLFFVAYMLPIEVLDILRNSGVFGTIIGWIIAIAVLIIIGTLFHTIIYLGISSFNFLSFQFQQKHSSKKLYESVKFSSDYRTFLDNNRM